MPPLNSLRAFESAGRHLSFTSAAQELNVTPGAISQQIRVLEEFLNTSLFKRRNRLIVLTDEGQICLPLVSQGFGNLIEAVEAVRKFGSNDPLTISSAPTFISKWLIPRLDKFKIKHPEIDVRIDASSRLVDFVNEDIDVGIRFSDGDYGDLESIYLFSFELIPVCSPKLVEKKKLSDLGDIKNHTLLHSQYDETDPSWPDWAMWLATVGVADVDTSHGIYFNQSEMLLEAAIEGQGIGLVGEVLVASDVAAGRLIQPFETKLPVRFCYHLVSSRQKARSAKVAAFREWIVEESAYLRDS
ncbi:MAG: transcriptional regulator GcvA [Gammaproteobacteria bacterium]|nr:transcriptional regulator GcvA [Gammaproteobacteria bacterium]